jgi:sulfur relay (sulfurtransferase) DsrF/TusC family protein
MAKYLAIVRTAYRATVEEQDDPGIWFVHAMKNGGAHVSILLRGDAVNYALQGQDARGLAFGRRSVKGPDISRDVRALVDAKIPVHVVAEDLSERGLNASPLVSGVERVPRNRVRELVEAVDHVVAF